MEAIQSIQTYYSLATVLLAYLFLVRYLRYQRRDRINSSFGSGTRPLSSMTTGEAYNIMTELQQFEFPHAFNKARKIALLKAGGIPTMSKLFAVTGQNNRRNAGKRAVDTEILLREVQSQERESIRYMQAVARMNFFHLRYRRAGKILETDLLHTLGDGLAEILRVINETEWRKLTDVEICAIGVFHKNLGDDMEIPYTGMPSCEAGWENGIHFAKELRDWTIQYEEEVAKPAATGDQYVRVYVDSATSAMPKIITKLVRKKLGYELDGLMRTSLNLEAPGPILNSILIVIRTLRKFVLRHLSLPRPAFLAVKAVDDKTNPLSGLYNFNHLSLRPWYIRPTFWTRWGPVALLLRSLGGKPPGPGGEKYHPEGYDLMTIGPQPQEGKGIEEMKTAIEYMKARGETGCPFSRLGKK
ncbi:hypothetical protein BGZ60DRAFT_376511 [Tricladium varicosporioides]|nr:hypothetical protein BGZ60DRAFT_376511 [Hymenoscyphus varicosporioides]